uniref:Uncharacterized protein n=1 Tax=Physcomitrium patens TaxID=3218 RepID=A0A2K1IRD8_PHYPA|nr:hypothetical protein PHYPA_025962 [Physcomitrium patens]
MVSLTRLYLFNSCMKWLKNCSNEVVVEAVLKMNKKLADIESIVYSSMNK